MQLKGKKILLGVTGSIAAYKAAILLRGLIKQGAEVQVLITPAGKEFITPVTLSALSGKPVQSEFFGSTDGTWHSHVDMGLWADLLIVAPASANTISKMAHGICDNLLLTTYLSVKCPVIMAPAMDLDMFAHVSLQDNLAILRNRGVEIIEPTSGELASGLEGKGRMEEPEVIVERIIQHFSKKKSLIKKILITAGPTHEKIDPVRFIGNYSSGKMGFALAKECALRGAEVILIAGPVQLDTPHPNIKRINVTSAKEMYDAALANFEGTDVAILCAAVADFTPEIAESRKVKRGKEDLTLNLKPTRDIAATLGANKNINQILVGFALETHNEEENALGKLRRKNLDFIVLNSLNDNNAGFMHNTNKISIYTKEGASEHFELKSKDLVANDIIDFLSDY